MKEHPLPRVLPDHWRESRYLSFAEDGLHLAGDPATATDFARALSYLETITEHFLEFGPLEEKTAWDVAYELSYHNAWHQYEVEAERKTGEKQAEYQEINLYQLRALSKRRLLAMTETGREDAASTFVDQLIEQAIAEEEALDSIMTPAPIEP